MPRSVKTALVSADLCGPAKNIKIHNFLYVLSFYQRLDQKNRPSPVFRAFVSGEFSVNLKALITPLRYI